ncbi:hypothetical protein JCM10213_008171 [Rhodosporidiobolus nylandii]
MDDTKMYQSKQDLSHFRVLPADLHLLILEQLVEAISLHHPPHYEDLRTAAMVCKDWGKMAQKLMWEAVYLDSEEKARRFLAVEEKARMQELVLHDHASTRAHAQSWNTKPLLGVVKRCRSVERFVCTLSFDQILAVAPAFLARFFPSLRHFELIAPYRLGQPQPLPALLSSITLLPTWVTPHTPTKTAHLIAHDCEQGLLLRLTDWFVQSGFDLPVRGGALSRQIRRCHIADAVGSKSRDIGQWTAYTLDLGSLLPQCTSLQHLSIGVLRNPHFLDALPPSLITMDIAEVTFGFRANLLDVLPPALPRLSNLARLRIGNWSQVVEECRAEDVKAVEQACEAQGVELVKV